MAGPRASERFETRHEFLKWKSFRNGPREMDVRAVWLGRGRETSPSPGPGPAAARANPGHDPRERIFFFFPTRQGILRWQSCRNGYGPWLPDDSRPRVLSLSKLSKCLSVQVSEVPWCRVSGCRVSRARYYGGIFIRRCLPRPDAAKFF